MNTKKLNEINSEIWSELCTNDPSSDVVGVVEITDDGKCKTYRTSLETVQTFVNEGRYIMICNKLVKVEK